MVEMKHYGISAHERVTQLMEIIDRSPTAYQAIEQESKLLASNGFMPLRYEDKWQLEGGGQYYLEIGDAAIIAFRVGRVGTKGFHITGAHSDSPGLRIKANPEMIREGLCQLNVEPYGGLIMRTWLDRPLSVAGRIIVSDGEGGVESRLVDVDQDLLIIPSLAIHMDRTVNDEGAMKAQKMLLPVYAIAREGSERGILDIVADCVNLDKHDILDYDLHLYAREKGCFIGENREFFSIGRIDNQAMALAQLSALIESDPTDFHQLVVINDNEEIGSGTRRGANSAMLRDVLKRIILACGGDEEDFFRALGRSFIISADQAHAVHPGFPEVADPTNRPQLNKGPVIKVAANKSYNTDGKSAARFKLLAQEAGVPIQVFHNHSDRKGGSTIGPITERWTTIEGVDVGNPMLSMHSVRELAGVEDHESMIRLLKVFFNSNR